jgi:N-dimethylarginine dimethylaminohydrolase
MEVNAWTQFGTLETVVVGRADESSRHLTDGPTSRSVVNGPLGKFYKEWPSGESKDPSSIRAAQFQLDNLVEVLEAESVTVKTNVEDFDTELHRTVPKTKTQVGGDVKKPKASVLRGSVIEDHKYCSTCPRDTVITMGNTIMRATMSNPQRKDEYQAFSSIISSCAAKRSHCRPYSFV